MEQRLLPFDAEEDDPETTGEQVVLRYRLAFDEETMARLKELEKRLATLPKGHRIAISLPPRGKS